MDSPTPVDGGGGILTVSRSLSGVGNRLSSADPVGPVESNLEGVAPPPEARSGSEPDLSVSCHYGGPDLPRSVSPGALTELVLQVEGSHRPTKSYVSTDF